MTASRFGRAVLEQRTLAAWAASVLIGLVLMWHYPATADQPVLGALAVRAPGLYLFITKSYTLFLFTTPFLVLTWTLGRVSLHLGMVEKKDVVEGELPAYPSPETRPALEVILGEVHHPTKPVAAEKPRWLRIPKAGLHCGIAIFGAIGSGKTASAMKPLVTQLLGYKASDPLRRIGALVLEVKGDFCHAVRGILERFGRGEDYIEVSLTGRYLYNPLYAPKSDAYAQAYAIAQLLNNLFGKNKDPFWQSAYTNANRWVILLHKVLYGYVTFMDIYDCLINPDLLRARLLEADAYFNGTRYWVIDPEVYGDERFNRRLCGAGFEMDEETGRLRRPAQTDNRKADEQLEMYLTRNDVPYEVVCIGGAGTSGTYDDHPDSMERRRAQFEECRKWYEQDWMRMEERLRTSIVEGVSVYFANFASDPDLKRVFCPPKEAYDRTLNVPDEDGVYPYGEVLPSFSWLIENGKVCALNFPMGLNPGLAKAIGTMMKLDFQSAALARIPELSAEEAKSAGERRHFREVAFICDEYQSFVSVGGEGSPIGDEQHFALSRQALEIPIVATQSVSSLKSALPGEHAWRTLLQTFRTKVFLTLSDDASIEFATKFSGKEERTKISFDIQEQSQDTKMSLSGRTVGDKRSVSLSKRFSRAWEERFNHRDFATLKVYQAIVFAFDGVNQQPAIRCYLKPGHRPVDLTWFEQHRRGMHP